MIDWPFISSLLLIGLFGSGHCVGMCGGFSVALGIGCSGSAMKKQQYMFFAQIGRLISYSLIGILFGWSMSLLQGFFDHKSILFVLRAFANVMLILMALYIARWWFGLAKLEQLAKPVWQRVNWVQQKFLPIQSYLSALVVGVCWGWLPCGLVYSALATSVSQANPVNAGLGMFAFGLGTIPSVWLLSSGASFGQRLITANSFRYLIATALIAFASSQLWQML